MPTRTLLWSRPHKSHNNKQHIYFDLQYGSGAENRRQVHTKILLDSQYWGSKGLKRTHPNYITIRKAIESYEERIKKGEDMFYAKQISLEQFKLYVEGKSDFSSILKYIETEIKQSRKPVTYKDYLSTYKTFKTHLGLSNKALRFEDITIKLLKDFKRLYLATGKSNNSFNSIVDKIRAIYNDAYENGVVYSPLTLPRRYKMPKTKTEWNVCTFEEFSKAIERANTQLEWESLVMWLLQFCLRGFYFSDFPLLSEEQIQDNNDEYKTWCIDKEIVIAHTRNKNIDRQSEKMYIRIDRYPTAQLFHMLKYSFMLRFWNTNNRDKIGDINDRLSIFRYDKNKSLEDLEFHQSNINSYQKAIRRVLPNHPMKYARKCFKTIANTYTTSRIADLLIGHSSDTGLNERSYNDNTYEDIVKEVYDTHTRVLERFKASELCQLLQDKLIALTERNVMPKWILGWCLENTKDDAIYLYEQEYDTNYKKYFKNYNEERFIDNSSQHTF
ncbi:MAG: phage integrase SAM-like domain-containing protein [Flavobacteriaceae bacterium]|nr:phage integrase SAM-like domain-containing protein [Flavobacteriaceae bacterium]